MDVSLRRIGTALLVGLCRQETKAAKVYTGATNEPTNVGSASSTNVEAISGAKTNPIIIKGGGDITAPVESTKEIGKRRYNVPHKHKQRRKRQNLYHHLSQASVSMPTYTKPPQNHIKALPEPHRNITTTTLRPPSTLQRFAGCTGQVSLTK